MANNQTLTGANIHSLSALEKAMYLGQMQPLLKVKVLKTTDAGDINVGFTVKGNNHLYSDTFGRTVGFTKVDLATLDTALANAAFVKQSPSDKPRRDGVTKFYYYKDSSRNLYYNVAEVPIKYKSGKIKLKRYLYSVTDRIR